VKFLSRTLVVSLVVTTLQAFQAVTIPASAATSFQSGSDYFAFERYTSNGTWTKPYGVSQVSYLVVAGGGRGGGSQDDGHYSGGGGGGGGVRFGSLNVTASTYSVVVGAGQAANGCSSGRGGNSTLSGSDITTVSATGGGSGSCSTSFGSGGIAGNSGGSGGGGGSQVPLLSAGTGNAGGYSPVEGFAGGAARADSFDGAKQAGGGGGGASEAGQAASLNIGGCAGRGGNGYTSTITGSSVVYGGGGGGGTRSYSCAGAGAGGTGGGGTGGLSNAQGTAGTDGLGGGGGGTSKPWGNRGGNGVVIIRYAVSAPSTPDLAAASDSGSSNSDNVTSQTSITLTGLAVGDSTIQIFNGSNAIGSSCTSNISTGAYSCTLTGLTSGTYSLTARSSFGGGSAISSTSALSVIIDSAAPTLTPGTSISVAENQTSVATLGCNETCTLTMTSGVDSAAVTFTSLTGVLVLKMAPDFEAPTDVGANNTYSITLQGIDPAGNTATLNITITITNVNETAIVNAPTVSGVINKGISTSITVTTNVSGKLRFFAGGKRISSCLAVTTSGSYPSNSATCAWKPAVTGRQFLTATLTPTDNTFSASTSARTEVFVLRRGTTR
jgi:mucin-19